MASLHWTAWVGRLSRSTGTSGFEHVREWAVAHGLQSSRSRAALIAGSAAFGLLALVSLRSSSSAPAARTPSFGLAAGFEANVGQAARSALFVARGEDFVLLLDPHGVRLQSPGCGASGCDAFRLRLIGSSDQSHLYGEDPLPRQARYREGLLGAPVSTPTYASVVYKDVYPGVDMRFSGYQGELQYAFSVDRGSAPDSIRLEVDGAMTLDVDAAGALLATGERARLRHAPPSAFQLQGGDHAPVDVRYVKRGPHEVGFAVGAYDIRRPLVIRCARGFLSTR
jgi:large repetitive protein